jgi:chromosome segregation ATPase
MTDALEAQNRALRARMAELEDALERAQHAAALAGQLQELIDAEAGVSQARSEFDAARDALQSGIFSAGEGDVEELQRIGEHERRARHALEEQVQGLEQARSGVIRTLPESV